jgi:hypothetical protein
MRSKNSPSPSSNWASSRSTSTTRSRQVSQRGTLARDAVEIVVDRDDDSPSFERAKFDQTSNLAETRWLEMGNAYVRASAATGRREQHTAHSSTGLSHRRMLTLPSLVDSDDGRARLFLANTESCFCTMFALPEETTL